MNCYICFIVWLHINEDSYCALPPLPRSSPAVYVKARSRHWFDEIVMNSARFGDDRYVRFFCFKRAAVESIVERLTPQLRKKVDPLRKSLSVSLQVHIALWRLAHAESYSCIGERFVCTECVRERFVLRSSAVSDAAPVDPALFFMLSANSKRAGDFAVQRRQEERNGQINSSACRSCLGPYGEGVPLLCKPFTVSARLPHGFQGTAQN